MENYIEPKCTCCRKETATHVSYTSFLCPQCLELYQKYDSDELGWSSNNAPGPSYKRRYDIRESSSRAITYNISTFKSLPENFKHLSIPLKALAYCSEVLKGEALFLEPAIISDIDLALRYHGIKKDRVLEIESVLLNNALTEIGYEHAHTSNLFNYVWGNFTYKSAGGNFQEGIDFLVEKPENTVSLSNAKGGRIPEGEYTLLHNFEESIKYIRYHCNGRFKRFELFVNKMIKLYASEGSVDFEKLRTDYDLRNNSLLTYILNMQDYNLPKDLVDEYLKGAESVENIKTSEFKEVRLKWNRGRSLSRSFDRDSDYLISYALETKLERWKEIEEVALRASDEGVEYIGRYVGTTVPKVETTSLLNDARLSITYINCLINDHKVRDFSNLISVLYKAVGSKKELQSSHYEILNNISCHLCKGNIDLKHNIEYEKLISKDDVLSYQHACYLNDRFPEGEPTLLKSAKFKTPYLNLLKKQNND